MNKDSAIAQSELNNVNQVTPYGSINYNQSGTAADGTPQFTATTTLSPELQKLVGANISNSQGNADLMGTLQGNAASTISKPLDLSWSATEGKLDELNRNTLDPQWAQQQASQEQKLYNAGVAPGSAAYDTAMRNFNQSKSDAYNGMYLAGHNTAVNDLTQQYNSPINTLTALQSGSQVSQPGVGTTAPTAQTGIQTPDYAGMVQQTYKDQLAASTSAMGGLFGLGGTLGVGAMKYSDRRLKRDIERIGTGARGLPVYAFRYLWSDTPEIGFMADEVAKVAPWAVGERGGFLMVDYGAI